MSRPGKGNHTLHDVSTKKAITLQMFSSVLSRFASTFDKPLRAEIAHSRASNDVQFLTPASLKQLVRPRPYPILSTTLLRYLGNDCPTNHAATR